MWPDEGVGNWREVNMGRAVPVQPHGQSSPAPCWWEARLRKKEEGIELVTVMVCISQDTSEGVPGHQELTE